MAGEPANRPGRACMHCVPHPYRIQTRASTQSRVAPLSSTRDEATASRVVVVLVRGGRAARREVFDRTNASDRPRPVVISADRMHIVSDDSLPMVGSCSWPRNIYIDLGVNWCNTLRLFEDLDPKPKIGAPYEVFGFEASPLIQPYAEQYFKWLNGERAEEPLNCLPRSGSTRHLKQYASLYGCPANSDEVMRQCMWSKLERHLEALRPDPQLNSSRLIKDRLDRARFLCEIGESYQNRFTFIPAAAGSARDGAWLKLFSPPHQLIRGGATAAYALPANHSNLTGPQIFRDKDYDYYVRTVDISRWIDTSFLHRDHIILKMDIEGAEHGVLEQMILQGTVTLVDMLVIECHGSRSLCRELLQRVKKAAPSLKIMHEGEKGSDGKAFEGTDSHSKMNLTEAQAVLKACA